MITFVSTFPPIMCGIGTYTSYLVRSLPAETWRVMSFRQDEFFRSEEVRQLSDRVAYVLSASDPLLPPGRAGELLWFQHAFGMWGEHSQTFLQLVKDAKGQQRKVIASFHTIHSESHETDSGMSAREEHLLGAVLPWLDAVTVFTDGAYRALQRAFPQHQGKVVVLRHGVHLYPRVSQAEAKERLLGYLATQPHIPVRQKQQVTKLSADLLDPQTVLLGTFGFITGDKDPLKLYELGRRLRDRLPDRRVLVLYIGTIQKRKDRRRRESQPILDQLRSIHDERDDFFVEDYLSEAIFPYAFRALDFAVFWCQNATQSGRMAHAQGTGTCVIGRRMEGIGETLDLAGLHSAVSLDDLAEKIARLVRDSALRQDVERSSWHYSQEYSFENQAHKHLLLEAVIRSGGDLPLLDRTKPTITFILPRLALARRDGLEDSPAEVTAFLNVADDVDLCPQTSLYHKIPLQDGVSVPPWKMRDAIQWIANHIQSNTIVVFCRYGKGRSASVMIGYLCSIGLEYKHALNMVASRCPGLNPLPDLSRTIQTALQGEQDQRSKDARRFTFAYPLEDAPTQVR